SAQIREILISESTWEEMTCLFAPSLVVSQKNVVFCLLIDSDKVVNEIIPHLLIEFFAHNLNRRKRVFKSG
ncbi:hypothetical protein OSL33_25225, partial [Escherichia coli]|nr:hypothetical protein [Escherichia coli]